MGRVLGHIRAADIAMRNHCPDCHKVFLAVRVVSGGQTGVDQAALRAAKASGLEIGGWCPPKRMSESGRIPESFPLEETPEERSPTAPDVPRSLRTEWNVRDSDATLILRDFATPTPRQDDSGTTWTFECAVLYGRPVLLCDVRDPHHATITVLSTWLRGLGVETLNVAGPAESIQPGIGVLTEKLLRAVFSILTEP
jgi:hypothetical protein